MVDGASGGLSRPVRIARGADLQAALAAAADGTHRSGGGEAELWPADSFDATGAWGAAAWGRWGPGAVGIVWEADEQGRRYPVEIVAGGYLVSDPCCPGGHSPQHELSLDATQVVSGPPHSDEFEVAHVAMRPDTWACGGCGIDIEPVLWHRERLDGERVEVDGRLMVRAPAPEKVAQRASDAFDVAFADARRHSEQELAFMADEIRRGITGEAWVAVDLPVAMYHRATGRPEGVGDGDMFVELEAGGSPAVVQGTVRLRQVTTSSSGLRIDVCAMEEQVSAGKVAELLLPWMKLKAAVQAAAGRTAHGPGGAEGAEPDAVSSVGPRGSPGRNTWRGSLCGLWEDRAGYGEWEDAPEGVVRWLAGAETAWSVWSHSHERVLAQELSRMRGGRDGVLRAGARAGDGEFLAGLESSEAGGVHVYAAIDEVEGLGL